MFFTAARLWLRKSHKCRGCRVGSGAGGHGVGGENESCHGVYADEVCCGSRCGAARAATVVCLAVVWPVMVSWRSLLPV